MVIFAIALNLLHTMRENQVILKRLISIALLVQSIENHLNVTKLEVNIMKKVGEHHIKHLSNIVLP